MATIAARRTELSSALATEGLDYRDTWQGEPPYVLAFFNGTGEGPRMDYQVTIQFRILGILAKATDDVALSAADTMANDILHALIELEGWRIDGIEPAQRVTLGTDTVYAVAFTVSVPVEIT